MSIKTRLSRLEGQSRTPAGVEKPASARWLRVLEVVRPWFLENGKDEIACRIDEAIAFLQAYLARGEPGPFVEDICQAWLVCFDPKSGRAAFLGTDMGRELREREQIDRWRRGEVAVLEGG